jgi:hypothetical protein
MLTKQVDEHTVYSEEEAEATIQKFKDNAGAEGYEVVNYSSVHKEKKSKGEVIDEYWVVKITKKWC